MPRRVEPCLATLVDKPPMGPDWALEVKWDGYRLAVHVEPGEARAITRGGYDWTKKFGAIVAEAREFGHTSMIIDGEAVVLDDQGRSDFGMLQRAIGKKPSLHDAGEIIFYAFDLLYLDGHDLHMPKAPSSSESRASTVSKVLSPSDATSPITLAAGRNG